MAELTGGLVDDLGASVPLAAPPRRVVSLVPSLTEAVAATVLGVLAGATDYCTHPASLDVVRVGGSKYPNIARVLDVGPDLVLANSEENRPQDAHALRDAGVPVWVTAAAATVEFALESVGRMFGDAFGMAEPEWLVEARRVWAEPVPVWTNAVIPVWRRPWVVVGGGTFAGDVLLRLGIENAYADAGQRYPRPKHDELRAAGARLIVLPDEPYEFTVDDGPGYFPGSPCALVSGRHLTWCGPSLLEARTLLARQLSSPVTAPDR